MVNWGIIGLGRIANEFASGFKGLNNAKLFSIASKTKENLISAFEKFILNLPFYGYSIICIDNNYLKNIEKKIKNKNIITYSLKNNKADVYIDNINNDLKSSYFSLKINKVINGYKLILQR